MTELMVGTQQSDTHQKALRINLDPRWYGTIAEIGAGQGARPDGTDWVVTGSVTAHGTPAPAEVRVSGARVEGETVRFAATARLDRTSFGVIKKKGMVGRMVTVLIEAVGQPA